MSYYQNPNINYYQPKSSSSSSILIILLLIVIGGGGVYYYMNYMKGVDQQVLSVFPNAIFILKTTNIKRSDTLNSLFEDKENKEKIGDTIEKKAKIILLKCKMIILDNQTKSEIFSGEGISTMQFENGINIDFYDFKQGKLLNLMSTFPTERYNIMFDEGEVSLYYIKK